MRSQGSELCYDFAFGVFSLYCHVSKSSSLLCAHQRLRWIHCAIAKYHIIFSSIGALKRSVQSCGSRNRRRGMPNIIKMKVNMYAKACRRHIQFSSICAGTMHISFLHNENCVRVTLSYIRRRTSTISRDAPRLCCARLGSPWQNCARRALIPFWYGAFSSLAMDFISLDQNSPYKPEKWILHLVKSSRNFTFSPHTLKSAVQSPRMCCAGAVTSCLTRSRRVASSS